MEHFFRDTFILIASSPCLLRTFLQHRTFKIRRKKHLFILINIYLYL